MLRAQSHVDTQDDEHMDITCIIYLMWERLRIVVASSLLFRIFTVSNLCYGALSGFCSMAFALQ